MSIHSTCSESGPAGRMTDPRIVIGQDAISGKPIEIPLDELTRHTNIIGDSGSGKSNANAWILTLLPSGIEARWIDSKRESYGLMDAAPGGLIVKPSELYGNPLEPIGDPATSWASRFEKVAHLLKIDERTWPELATVLSRTTASMNSNEPPPSLADLILILKRLGETENSKYLTAAQRIQRLANSLGPVAYVRQGPELNGRYRWIAHDYFGYEPAVRNALEAIDLDRTMQKALLSERPPGLWQLRLYDEGLDFFSKEFTATKAGSGHVSYQKRATSQLRSSGIGLVTCFQYPSQVDSSVTGNAATLIVLGQTDPKEARLASRMLTGEDDLTKEILTMPRGTAFLRNTNLFQQVQKILIPEVPRAPLPAEEIIRNMKPEIDWMKSNSIMSPEPKDSLSPIPYHEIVMGRSAPIDYPDEVPDDWGLLLLSIAESPSSTSVGHYRALSWSAGKGTRVKTEMINSGFLQCQRRPNGNGRPAQVLSPTSRGENLYSGLFKVDSELIRAT